MGDSSISTIESRYSPRGEMGQVLSRLREIAVDAAVDASPLGHDPGAAGREDHLLPFALKLRSPFTHIAHRLVVRAVA
jgi:hypothetical protein